MSRAGKAVAVAVCLGVMVCGTAIAQSSGGQYQIDSAVIAGGGGPIAGGDFQITSTLGQPATATLAGANFILFNGFWSPVGGGAGDLIFADGFDAH